MRTRRLHLLTGHDYTLRFVNHATHVATRPSDERPAWSMLPAGICCVWIGDPNAQPATGGSVRVRPGDGRVTMAAGRTRAGPASPTGEDRHQLRRNESIRRLKIAESGVEYGWWACRFVFGTVSPLSTSQPHRSTLSTLTMDRPRAPARAGRRMRVGRQRHCRASARPGRHRAGFRSGSRASYTSYQAASCRKKTWVL